MEAIRLSRVPNASQIPALANINKSGELHETSISSGVYGFSTATAALVTVCGTAGEEEGTVITIRICWRAAAELRRLFPRAPPDWTGQPPDFSIPARPVPLPVRSEAGRFLLSDLPSHSC